MATVILSPHLDDAVMSCWHVLTEADDVTVVNVFGGSPNGGPPVGWWDRLTRATSSLARMEERRAEDAEALRLAGRAARSLDFLDAQYRETAQTAAAIATRLAGGLQPGALILAPAAIGDVPDHALVRGAALDLRRDGFEVALYADLPHAIRYGWPSSVTGEAETELDADAFWEQALAQVSLPPQLTDEVHTLAGRQLADKLEAVRTYRSQLPGLVALNPRLADPTILRHEVVWRLA
jgi:LmbE family N-acetylglucosaminyl deacetylase